MFTVIINGNLLLRAQGRTWFIIRAWFWSHFRSWITPLKTKCWEIKIWPKESRIMSKIIPSQINWTVPWMRLKLHRTCQTWSQPGDVLVYDKNNVHFYCLFHPRISICSTKVNRPDFPLACFSSITCNSPDFMNMLITYCVTILPSILLTFERETKGVTLKKLYRSLKVIGRQHGLRMRERAKNY